MPIDGCEHTFEHLASVVLPSYMDWLRSAIARPYDARVFATRGQGVKAIATLLSRPGDFSGCYVFLADGQPFYVGVSRSVIDRIVQHVRRKTHFSASLAYRMAYTKVGHLGPKAQRNSNMTNPDFIRAFETARSCLVSAQVAVLEIRNDLEMYLFEPYAAMKLGTHEWNSFRAH